MSRPVSGPRPSPGGAAGRRGISIFSAHDLRRPVSRGSSANLGRPVSGPRPSPGGAAERRGISIFSAHTGEGRYPGDHPNLLRPRLWTPACAEGERCLCGGSFKSRRSSASVSRPVSGPQPTPWGAAERRRISIFSAHTGEGRYPGNHLQPLQARLWTPASAGGSGVYVGAHLNPGDHPQTSAGPSLDPGLRRGERREGGGSIISQAVIRNGKRAGLFRKLTLISDTEVRIESLRVPRFHGVFSCPSCCCAASL